MFEQIREKTASLKAQITALQAEAAEQIKPLLMSFIKDNPQVKAIRWTQYTPYFNDGDTCTFSVNEPEFNFGDEDAWHDSFGNAVQDGLRGYTWSGTFEPKSYLPTLEECSVETERACLTLAAELQGLDDALQALFGDHVRVTVTADGVDVDGYDHD